MKELMKYDFKKKKGNEKKEEKNSWIHDEKTKEDKKIKWRNK